MHERVKQIRAERGLTQEQFANMIGLTRNYVARIEIGDREPSDRTIADICRVFGVSEIWLRTGAGEPFPPASRKEEMTALFAELLNDRPEAFRSKLITALLRFDPNGPEWDVLERIYEGIQAEANKKD